MLFLSLQIVNCLLQLYLPNAPVHPCTFRSSAPPVVVLELVVYAMNRLDFHAVASSSFFFLSDSETI
jgi:hypothetical protein